VTHYVNSFCGHGKLVDIAPYDSESGLLESELKARRSLNYNRWGLITVVLKTGTKDPVECCSFQEAEFETREEALKACEAQKRHAEEQLNQALAVLDGAASQAWALARVYLSDLVDLRQKLAENGRRTCEAALCFEEGTGMWLVDDDCDATLCEEHLKGKKVYGLGGREVVFEGWEKYRQEEEAPFLHGTNCSACGGARISGVSTPSSCACGAP
jgi:hypothetical protein